MKISAIIATYNRRDALAACLNTLMDQTIPQSEYEIVVVVDGSTDGTIELLKSLPRSIIVIEQSNRGQTAALNAGAKVATGDLVLFLDDDMLCDRGLLSAHLTAHSEHSSAVVIGRTKSVLRRSCTISQRLFHEDLEQYYAQLLSDGRPRLPHHACAGPNRSMRRELFLAVGGYDEVLFPRRWEDVDLGLRLWKNGNPFKFEPGAIVSHLSVKTKGKFWTDAIEDGASMAKLCRRHPEMRPYVLLTAVMSSSRLRRSAMRVASGLPNTFLMFSQSLTALFDMAPRAAWAQRLAMRFFGISYSVAVLAGARRELRLWRSVEALFGERCS